MRRLALSGAVLTVTSLKGPLGADIVTGYVQGSFLNDLKQTRRLRHCSLLNGEHAISQFNRHDRPRATSPRCRGEVGCLAYSPPAFARGSEIESVEVKSWRGASVWFLRRKSNADWLLRNGSVPTGKGSLRDCPSHFASPHPARIELPGRPPELHPATISG